MTILEAADEITTLKRNIDLAQGALRDLSKMWPSYRLVTDNNGVRVPLEIAPKVIELLRKYYETEINRSMTTLNSLVNTTPTT